MKMVVAFVVAFLLLCITGGSDAAPVTFYFAGSLSSFDPELTSDDLILNNNPAMEGVFSVGNTFRGSYTFASDQPNATTVPGIGRYEYPDDSGRFSMRVTINSNSGPITFQSGSSPDGSSSIMVTDDHPRQGDSYAVWTFDAVSSSPVMNQYEAIAMNISLVSQELDRIIGTALPLTPPDFGLFRNELTPFDLDASGMVGDEYLYTTVRGQLNYFSTQPVPIPGAVWLLGSGLAGLLGLRRRLV